VTGLKVDYAKHCRARWGSYVEASDDLDVTNTMRDRTSPCIVLGPTGNIQGSVRCYNLETKSIVKRRTITPLPMPDRVIRRVIALGKRSKQKRKSAHLQFLNRVQQEFDWVIEETAGLVKPEPSETDALPAEIPGVQLESDFESEAVETPPPTERSRPRRCRLSKHQSPQSYRGCRDCRSGLSRKRCGCGHYRRRGVRRQCR
jgi:hypothetical protein